MRRDNTFSLYLPFLVFWVGQRCTMHCKHCCNLIPYANQRLYNIDASLEALELLLQVATIERVQIQGGEPLTHPRLVEYIERIAQYPIQEVSMTTNGTILFHEELLHTLQKYPHIHITISDYEVRKEKREKVMKQLQEYGISYSLYNFLYGNGEWFYSGDFSQKRNDDDQEVTTIYEQCVNKICWTLAEGKLAVCGKIIILNQQYCLSTHDAHNILDLSLLKKEGGRVKESLITFIDNSQFFKEGCRYCLGTKQKVSPAIQLMLEEIAIYTSSRKGNR